MLHQPSFTDRLRRRWILHRLVRLGPKKLCQRTRFQGVEHLAALEGAALLVFDEHADAPVGAWLLGLFHPPVVTDAVIPEPAHRFRDAGNRRLDDPSIDACQAVLDTGGKLLISDHALARQLQAKTKAPRLPVTASVSSSMGFDLTIQPQSTEF